MYDVRPKRAAGDHAHTHAQNRFAVIPTTEKLGADANYGGRGVRIAFLDSGFYPHPDIADRIVAYADISGEEPLLDTNFEPAGHHWHGMQTTVTCAGDGRLSDGIYRGIANSAELVLVKVSRAGRITDESIEAGLSWVIANREKYNIRILNMSLGGDCDLATSESAINRLAERLVEDGVVVTVAAGNSANRRPIPPAASPSVITVGGYGDENAYSANRFDLYHSSYGETADGVVKPELIAPAVNVAAPILPGTKDYVSAEVLSMLASVPDYAFRPLLEEFHRDSGLRNEVLSISDRNARAAVEDELRRRKIVATHYQHVDGTSFAAPITASVVAQMIEANSSLTPAAVKNILASTATKLAGRSAIRQGFGVLNARAAVELAAVETHLSGPAFGLPRIDGSKILFTFHSDAAASVTLVGDLNGWSEPGIELSRSVDGLWRAEVPCVPAGSYRYKFLIDGERWTEDPSHGFKSEDGFGGFNSILHVG
jgi:serine protease AprX